ncbi:MAG: hypothetical protein ACMZI2_02845 [Candidatus Symbiodolus clandestinus]
MLEINNLDFEKSFFCDSYIANRHLSGKKNDNGFFTRYTTPVYEGSFNSLSTFLLRTRCAKKDVMLLIYKPKQLQFSFASKQLCTITSQKYKKDSKFFIFKVIKVSGKLMNYLFYISNKLNSLSCDINEKNYFYQNSPIELKNIQNTLKTYHVKTDFLYSSRRIAQQIVSFLSFTKYKDSPSKEIFIQKYSNNQSKKTENFSKITKNNFKKDKVYEVFKNSEYCLMLNISMKITSKLKIAKVNPLKRKIVKILFIHSKTCNIYLKDNFGKSAIDYALINRNQKIRQLFEPYYAKRIPQGIEHFP